jgi:hypothetical protein
LAEKIKVKGYLNEDSSISADIELFTVMIYIVFCSLIIHEFDKIYMYLLALRNVHSRRLVGKWFRIPVCDCIVHIVF